MAHINPFIFCKSCSGPIDINDELFKAFFNNESINCPKCESTLNWYAAIKNAIIKNFMGTNCYQMLGAKQKFFNIGLEPEKVTEIDFTKEGIGLENRILNVIYTPQSEGLFPIELHGNSPHRRIIGHKISLFPRPNLAIEKNKRTEVSVLVTWAENLMDEYSFMNLYDAFEAYAKTDYQGAIIPSNSAVESTLTKILKPKISQILSKNKADDFFKNEGTYSVQLNIILPLIIRLKGLTPLSSDIQGSLNRLRKLRNEVAHNGTISNPLEKNQIVELLAAALFGLKYLSFISAEIDAAIC